jgi:hypothetical protein
MSKETYEIRLWKRGSLSIGGSVGEKWREGVLLYREIFETGKRSLWEWSPSLAMGAP